MSALVVAQRQNTCGCRRPSVDDLKLAGQDRVTQTLIIIRVCAFEVFPSPPMLVDHAENPVEPRTRDSCTDVCRLPTRQKETSMSGTKWKPERPGAQQANVRYFGQRVRMQSLRHDL
jgi:hypothetical protein